jgi:MFS family permease
MSGGGGAVGLLLGGILTSYVSWRWIFFVNVPIAAVGLLLAPRALKESSTRPGRLDTPGAITVTGGMIALVYGVTNASTHGWGAAGTLAPLALAALLLGTFFAVERVSAAPLMPLSIFANRNRSGAYAMMLAFGTAIFSTFFFLTQYLQNVRGYSPIRAGLSFLPMAVGIMVAALITSRMVTRIGIRPPLLVGPVLAGVGMLWLTRLTVTSSYLDLLGPLLLLAFGMGQCFVPLTTTAVAGVKMSETGLASALLNTAQQVGGAVGLSVLGTIVASSINRQLAAVHGHPSASTVAAATTHAYTDGFTVAAGLVFAAFIVSLVVIRVQPSTAPAPVPQLADAQP